ncbi:MAG: protease complex subunit PrcB family protein [Nanoarchaeota archaeon]|nr:protease complex subunit PrcB family protein [Nanoarchaeota archaeon]
MVNKPLLFHSSLVLIGIIIVISVFYLDIVKTPQETEKKPGELSFKVLLEGTQNSLSQKQTRIAKSTTDWTKLWGEMFPEQILPSSPNFQEETIIALFLGEKPTGGYSIKVEKMINHLFYIEAIVKESTPGENCLLTQALTQPYTLVSIPKTNKQIIVTTVSENYAC